MIPKIIGVVVILALLGGGGYYYYTNMMNKPAEQETSPTALETPTATPTPAEVDPSEYTIKILNGSGIAGEAGRAQTLLENADFVIDSTGNADNYDYEETVIQAGSSVSDAWIEALIEELEKQYAVQGTVEELDDDDVDVVVIIGSEKSGSATPTGTAASDDAEDASSEATTTTPTRSPTPTTSN